MLSIEFHIVSCHFDLTVFNDHDLNNCRALTIFIFNVDYVSNWVSFIIYSPKLKSE